MRVSKEDSEATEGAMLILKREHARLNLETTDLQHLRDPTKTGCWDQSLEM